MICEALEALIPLLYANAFAALITPPTGSERALASVQRPNWHGIGAFGLAAALVFRHGFELYFFRVMKPNFTRRFACFFPLLFSSSGSGTALRRVLVAFSFPPQAAKPTSFFLPISPLRFLFGFNGKNRPFIPIGPHLPTIARLPLFYPVGVQGIGKPRPASTEFRSGWQGAATFASKTTPAVSRPVPFRE